MSAPGSASCPELVAAGAAADEIDDLASTFNRLADQLARQAVAETARAGYRCAVTTKQGSNRGAPLLELRRHAIKGVSLLHPLRFIRTMRQALAAAARA